MSAVWLRVRSDFRSSLGASIAIVLIIGLAGGVVLGAIAAGRRTQTAFVRHQASATVAWQATTSVSIALLIGLPLGPIVSRWLWSFADRLGVVPEVVMPLVVLALAIPSVLVVANLIAAVPGLIAARTKRAIVLGSE
jgi:hypothetical protein